MPDGSRWPTFLVRDVAERIAIYDGQLRIKEGALNAAWTTVTGNVDDFQVTDNRVGIRVGTKIHVKDGPVGAVWAHVSNASAFDLI